MPVTEAQHDWVAKVLGVSREPGAASETDASPPTVDQALVLRLSRLQARFPDAVRAMPDARSRLTATMAMTEEYVLAGDPRAAAMLDRLQKALGEPAGPEPAPKLPTSNKSVYELVAGDGQLVEYRKALLAWNAAKGSAETQVAALKADIATAAPTLAKAAAIVDGVMTRLGNQLADAIDAAMSSEDLGQRTKHHREAAELARNYLVTINFDPVFKAIDTNPVRTLAIRGTLSNALTKVIAALPA